VAESPADDGDWAAEVAAWLAETSTCTRCSEPLVRFEALIGAWLTAGPVEPPRVRGLCPGGETHTAGDVKRDSRFTNPEDAATAAREENGNAPH
jgi:hypothetical protein